MQVDQEIIDDIQLEYRLAKSAEQSRTQIDQRLMSFARVWLTAWHPDADEKIRERNKKLAEQAVRLVQKQKLPDPRNQELCAIVSNIAPMVMRMEPSREAFSIESEGRKKSARKMVESLPAWQELQHIRGFSSWGLATIIGEAGDLSQYSGVRKLYKRLGYAPNEAYPKGEKSTGRKIPRSTRGRIFGIITDPLFKAQWAADREDRPAHPRGPYGQVYLMSRSASAALDRPKGHAYKLALRVMTKALLHDVWRAWHGLPLDYVWTEHGEEGAGEQLTAIGAVTPRSPSHIEASA